MFEISDQNRSVNYQGINFNVINFRKSSFLSS